MNFDNGLHFKDIPKLQKLNNSSKHVFQKDEDLKRRMRFSFIPIYRIKKQNAPKDRIVDFLLLKSLF